MIAVLAGGVGAARFLRALLRVVEPSDVTAIVNVADDIVLHGLHISPDIDTVTYTLADAIDPERGWGLRDETWLAMESLGRFSDANWFNLGDRDLGTHLHRTQRLRDGATLTKVTAELAGAWGLQCQILPVSNDPIETRVTIEGGSEIGFQEYFVGRQHSVPVESVRFVGADAAAAAPGVVDAISNADVVVVAPSNPIVSIGPILAVEDVHQALLARNGRGVVGISPIIAGAALKGPADRMLTELGEEASVVGVARRYRDLIGSLIIDTADADRVAEIEALGLAVTVTDTIMADPTVADALARSTIEAAQR